MERDYQTILKDNYETVRIETGGLYIEINSSMIENLVTSLNILRAVAGEWGIEQEAGIFENAYERGSYEDGHSKKQPRKNTNTKK